MYPRMAEWVSMRDKVDPEGVFVGNWHRRLILPPEDSNKQGARESKHRHLKTRSTGLAKSLNGGDGTEELASTTSEESFDLMHGAEAEGSLFLQGIVGDHEDGHAEEERCPPPPKKKKTPLSPEESICIATQ
jgi:D-arabinono-1,4-lactone oxidase